LIEERSPLMEEGDGGGVVGGEGMEGEERALQRRSKKKKGLTWGCVNSWLLRDLFTSF
jgi:hypothetical protein